MKEGCNVLFKSGSGIIICGEKRTDGNCFLCKRCLKDSLSTEEVINSPQAKPLNLSDEDGRERPLVADKRERDKLGDNIHQQNKELLDKDYIKEPDDYWDDGKDKYSEQGDKNG